MAIKRLQTEKDTLYYNTFTCYNYLPLIETTNGWGDVYYWFSKMKELYNVDVTGYVIMPNHIHSMLYLPKGAPDINKILSNGKRFLAYDLVENLEIQKQDRLLRTLYEGLNQREKDKGQLHKVFIPNSDIKECYTEKFIIQKLDYMHANPVSGKWNLVKDYTMYTHSSAGFYERNVQGIYPIVHYKDVW